MPSTSNQKKSSLQGTLGKNNSLKLGRKQKITGEGQALGSAPHTMMQNLENFLSLVSPFITSLSNWEECQLVTQLLSPER